MVLVVQDPGAWEDWGFCFDSRQDEVEAAGPHKFRYRGCTGEHKQYFREFFFG